MNIGRPVSARPVMTVQEMRLVITVEDFDRATSFFRDALGLHQIADFQNDGGRGALLDAGHATLEIFDEAQAVAIDDMEVGRRVSGQVRIAFQTPDRSSEGLWLRLGAIATSASLAPTESSSRFSARRRSRPPPRDNVLRRRRPRWMAENESGLEQPSRDDPSTF